MLIIKFCLKFISIWEWLNHVFCSQRCSVGHSEVFKNQFRRVPRYIQKCFAAEYGWFVYAFDSSDSVYFYVMRFCIAVKGKKKESTYIVANIEFMVRFPECECRIFTKLTVTPQSAFSQKFQGMYY